MNRAAALIVLLLGVVCALWADSFRCEGPSVVINGQKVFTLKASLDGRSPERRAEVIADTLRKANIRPPITIRNGGSGIWLMAGETQVVRITKAEADLAGTSVNELVQSWKSAVESAFAGPALIIPPGPIDLKLGEKRILNAEGRQSEECDAASENDSAVIVSRKGNDFVLEAIAPGTSVVRFWSTEGEAKITVNVAAAPDQGPRKITVDLYGSLANQSNASQAAEDVIRQQFGTGEPGEVISIFESVPTLRSGDVIQELTMKVRRVIPGKVDETFTVLASIRRADFIAPKEEALWYCNSPETIKSAGVLFNQELRPMHPVRMLFHHVNGSKKPMTVRVLVYNLSVKPATLALIAADGSPSKDPVRTGTEAGDKFIRLLQEKNYELVHIPGRTAAVVSIHTLDPGYVTSGLNYMALLSGGPEKLVVRAEASAPAQNAVLLASTREPISMARGTIPFDVNPAPKPLSEEVFASPYRAESVRCNIGGADSQVRVGQRLIKNLGSDKYLSGNYGVLYSVEAVLDNPTDQAATVDLVYEASAGYSGAVFCIDGQYLKPLFLQTKEQVKIISFTLAPHKQRNVRILTIPVSGSSYPATLFLRSNRPQPAGPTRPMDTLPGS